MLTSAHLDSPVGKLTLVASDAGLRAVLWEGDDPRRVPLGECVDDDHPVIRDTAEQLAAYFDGSLHAFDLPLDPVGTPFQLAAWHALRSIPYGETITYGEQAARMGDRRKARAVGAANGRNPLSIVVPCHRVIGRDGSLTGFAGGLDVKRALLDLERSRVATPAPALAP